MQYKLGNIDLYGIAFNGTVMEDSPFFTVELREAVDEKKLKGAIERALLHHPLFKTKVRYRKQYFLETNDDPIIVLNSTVEDRPKTFGMNTNDYPWRFTYFGTELYFEWCHVVTDGNGACMFLTDVLKCYFDLPMPKLPRTFPIETSFERFYDPAVKPIGQVKQPAGFSKRSFPIIRNGFRCQSHLLSIKTKDLMVMAKSYDTTPAALLAPLISRSVRMHIPKTVKNRNVSCGIMVDCRRSTGFDTMHNFILSKAITYTERFDELDLQTLGTIYRTMLDLFVQPETITAECTSMTKETRFLYRMRPLWLRRFLMKFVARYVKNTMNNVGLTYIGRTQFPKELNDNIQKVTVRNWPDIGYSCAAVIDFNGTLYIDFCENYVDKGVVPTFLQLCENYGIPAKLEKEQAFEQARMKVNFKR